MPIEEAKVTGAAVGGSSAGAVGTGEGASVGAGTVVGSGAAGD
jgi:hypothetical protein